ncbi:MAG: zinc-ribbon domain containing protein [Candidatus Kerfeldbacteria bacterium]|nr:zinc-ribbon domain containing protein [Candidatus Kerfeldbacteria bacterium]
MSICQTCQTNFTITSNDQLFYDKVKAPLPVQCPQCRLQKRLAYRNERSLFSSICGLCHKNILSLYNPADQFTVYCNDCWWSDKWEPTNYGRAIDWSRSLIEQWNEVRRAVPRLALVSLNSENSDYTNMSSDNKNCYLLFAAENNENCSYGKLVQKCKDCFDCSFIYDSELCYGCVNIRNCYHSIYLQDCQDSRDCGFSIGLRGCSNVWFSANLHNKEYYIANQSVPPAEFQQRVQVLTADAVALKKSYQTWRELNKDRIVKYAHNIKSDGCTGDSLTDCKRIYDSFDVTGGQDCAYMTDALESRDCYDASFIYYKPELVYDSLSMLQCYNVQYSVFTFYTSDSQYCDQVHNSKNIMLSSCLRNKQFVILNKQYSQAEYEVLLPKVIAAMTTVSDYGQLPPAEHSLFAYNDTVAQEYFPLTKQQALAAGYRWNNAADERIHKPFKLTQSESVFYQTMNLPEPTEHPELRHRARMALRNPRQLWQRPCQCTQTNHNHATTCPEVFLTSYSTDRPEQVYCERCYQQTVI